MFNFLQPHRLHHTRPPCPSPTPEACSDLSPLSWWCYPTISSSVVTLSYVQSFPASGSLPMSQFFTSDWSFSFNISPSKEYSGLISFRSDWFGFCAVQGTLKNLLHHSSKTSVLWRSASFILQLSHPYMKTGKTIALTRRNSVDKKMSLLLNMLSRLVQNLQQYP